MVFHWSLSDRKSAQVSMTLLSILTNLDNAIVWIILFLQTNPELEHTAELLSN